MSPKTMACILHGDAIVRHNTHPGFKAVAKSLAKRQDISVARASAELAGGTRRAGKAARNDNARLNSVKGR
jgi:hypothetical protein